LRACCVKDRARFAGYQTLPELLAALPVEKALAERFADAAGARGAL
jgi:hypothetical protein